MLAACGGGGGAANKTTPKQDAVDERKAERGAKDLLDEIYENIGHANTDSLMSLLADPLIVFGPRRADALGTRADALVTLRGLFDAKAKKSKPSLQSGGLSVVASPGGHSAWAVDTIEVEGQALAVTAVLANADDIWVVTAAAIAKTPSMREVRAELKKDAVVPPGMAGVPKIDPAARGAVERFTKGLADPTGWAADLGSRTDAVVIGPTAGDVTRGKADLKKLWKKRAKESVRCAAAGELTAGSTPDGELAWVSAPVVRFAEDDEPLPLRLFAVFEKNGSDWKMIALQELLAVDQPGVAVNFKKIAAPGLPKAEEPPKKPAEPEKKPAAKKKKKKKKKKPVDDE